MQENVERYVRYLLMMNVCFVGGMGMLWGMAPAAVPVMVIVYGQCGLLLLPCICVMCGLAMAALGVVPLHDICTYIFADMEYSGVQVIEKYAVLMAGAMFVLKYADSRNRRAGRSPHVMDRGAQLVLSGMTLMANVIVYIDRPVYALSTGAIEAGLYICLYHIIKPGLRLIWGDGGETWKRDGDAGQEMISLLLLSAMCLWVMPGDMGHGINILLMTALAILLYVIYRTGAAYGFGIAVIAGGLMAVRQQQNEWLMWIILLALVMLIGRALAGKRKVTIAAFYIIGIILASVADDMMMLRSIGLAAFCVNMAVPLVLFMVVPHRIIGGVMDDGCRGECLQAAATEMNRLATAKIEDMANTFRRLDYTFAGSDEPGISLSQVGDLMEGFKNQISRMGAAREINDEKLAQQLKSIGMEDVRVTATGERGGRNRYFVAGRTDGHGMVLARQVAQILSGYFGRNIRTGLNSPSLFFDEYRSVCYEESAAFKGKYHVRRIKKYGSPVSGDNFSVKEYDDGRLVMMLSDGMGSGSLASCESCMMLDTMEEMLEAGFEPDYSISFANRCMSRRNQGRIFTTFDMVMIDMYDGVLKSYKQGAAVTYIVRGDGRENSVETITSTTLPIGILDDADCDVTERKLESGDVVVMVSDGISDMDDDDSMVQILGHVSTSDSKKIVDEILGKMLGQENSFMRDDVTVMVAVISKSEKSIKNS